MTEKKAKTVEDKLIDAFLPVYFWYLRAGWRGMGLKLTKDQASAIVQFFLPPPDALVRNMRKDLAKFLTPALYSPTWRRRFRKEWIRALQEELDEAIRERDPVMFAARESFSEFRASLEASGPPNWDRMAELGSARDFEETMRQRLTTLAENPAMLDTLFPPGKILDHRLHRRVVKGLGLEAYRFGIIELLSEFLLEGRSEVEPRLTRKSEIWLILGLAPDELEGLPRPIAFRKFFDAIFSLFMQADEAKLIEVMVWLIKFHLPRVLLGEGYYHREKRLDAPVGENLTLGDTVSDAAAQSAFDSVEMRIDYEIFLEDLPAAQRRSVELKKLAEGREVTFKKVCTDEGEDYTAVRRNLSRASKRWRER